MEPRVLLSLLKRKGWLLLLTFLFTVGATAVFTLRQPIVYESKTTFVAKLNPALIGDRNLMNAIDILGRRTEIVTTYAEVIKSRWVKDAAAETLDLLPQQKEGLAIDSRVIAGTTIIELTVRGNDPAVARDYARAVREATFTYVDNLYEMYELAVLDEAEFARPVKTNLLVNLIVAAAASIILGSGLVLLSEYISQYQSGSAATIFTRPPDGPPTLALQETLLALQAQLDTSQQMLKEFYAAAAHHPPVAEADSPLLITSPGKENGIGSKSPAHSFPTNDSAS